MSDNPPKHLELYLTAPAPCPYLEGKEERKVVTFLEKAHGALASPLIASGFRRSGRMFYRQRCEACSACIPIRLRVNEFHPDKNMTRILKKNADLAWEVREPFADEGLYALFMDYQQDRHADGEMGKMSFDEFSSMMLDFPAHTKILVGRLQDKIAAVMIVDELADGTSAVYSFFDPALQTRSLGSWMILKLAEYTRQRGGPYLYLGLWVAESQKMSYKSKFQPLEIFKNEKWSDFTG